jgi:hypothetical protein
MRYAFAPLLAALVAPCATAAPSSPPALFWDFQDSRLRPGATPATEHIGIAHTAGGNHVHVVDTNTTPRDPFSPDSPSNQSIHVFRSAGEATMPTLQITLPRDTPAGSTPFSSGTVTFDLFVEELSTSRGSVEVNLGTMSTPNSRGRPNSFAAFQINASNANPATQGRISYFAESALGADIKPTSAIATPNRKNTFSISWDTARRTYWIFLNGNLVTSSAFTVENVAGLSAIRFTTVNANTDISFFVDNIALHPKSLPAAVGETWQPK